MLYDIQRLHQARSEIFGAQQKKKVNLLEGQFPLGQ
jgi:hypothetical protein